MDSTGPQFGRRFSAEPTLCGGSSGSIYARIGIGWSQQKIRSVSTSVMTLLLQKQVLQTPDE